jgi:hypothetical protein
MTTTILTTLGAMVSDDREFLSRREQGCRLGKHRFSLLLNRISAEGGAGVSTGLSGGVPAEGIWTVEIGVHRFHHSRPKGGVTKN